MWLRSNPVTAARHFEYRLQLLIKDVLKSTAQPLGEIVDYVIRIEFQARGSPHAHTLLWVKNAPKLDVQLDEEVCDFIKQHVTCALPENDLELSDLVKKLQTHKHSSYCRKKGSCRFQFPLPPSADTIIAREPTHENADEIKKHAKYVLTAVHVALTNDDTPNDASLSDLLNKTCFYQDQCMKALAVSQRGKHIVLKRTPSECSVNPYNATILKAWQANIDLQYIVDPYACVMYIAAYMTKGEKGIGELLKQTCKEYKDKDIMTMLKCLGSTFMNHREVSAQEAVYRLLSIPYKHLSRQVVWICTDAKPDRTGVLKMKKDLENKDDTDEDISTQYS